MATATNHLQETSGRSSAANSGSGAHRTDVDGLRAIAVLAVVGFHCGVPWLGGGYVGVDVFFVISGYLICSIIWRELRSGTFSIARFYERRFKRIVPALCVVLLFCLAAGAVVLSPLEARRLGETAIATALSASNFLFIHRSGYFAPRAGAQPLLMTWSLAVEEQFYIAFPLVLICLRKLTRQSPFAWLAVLSACSLLVSVVLEFQAPTWNFYLPISRAWELGAGALLAVWQSERPMIPRGSWMADAGGAAGLLMLAASILLYSPATRFPGYEALLPVLGTVLILASEGGRANRMLGYRPLVGVGLMSYSLYLWHWPCLSLAEMMSGKQLRVSTTIVAMSIAFAAAAGSYFLVEKPFRAAKFARPQNALAAYGLLLVLLACAGGALTASGGLPGRAAKLAEIEKQAGIDRDRSCLFKTLASMEGQCVAPPNPGWPSVALLGDSHAESISKALRDHLSRDGLRLIVLAHEKCPPTQGATRWVSAREAELCRQFNLSALDYVLARPDVKVVILIAGWGERTYIPDNFTGDPASQDAEQNAANLKLGIQGEVSALESRGKKVILMDDFPEPSSDPVESVRYRELPERRALNRFLLSAEPAHWKESFEDGPLVLRPAIMRASAKLAEIARADADLTFVDPKSAFCRHERCYFANESELYYFDQDHLSDDGARLIVPLLPNLASVR